MQVSHADVTFRYSNEMGKHCAKFVLDVEIFNW